MTKRKNGMPRSLGAQVAMTKSGHCQHPSFDGTSHDFCSKPSCDCTCHAGATPEPTTE